MADSSFISDFRDLLAKHKIDSPRFAYGQRDFDSTKPKIYYSGPIFDQEEIVAAVSSFVEGHWSVAGEYVNRFEREFSKVVGVKHSVMVNSGSSADLLMVAAAKKRFGWKDGDGIIVSPCGFPTTISAITLNGLKPVFVDIEMRTLNFDTNWALLELVFDPSIKAIMVSPVLGNPPDMDRLAFVAKQYGVELLLDGCDSLGSTWNGRTLNSYCAASTCSFFPAHHISTLQGGMVSSNDEELIKIATSMATWGRDCHCRGAGNLLPNGTCGCRFSPWLEGLDTIVDHRYVYSSSQAYNLLPLDLQGAIGLAQLKKLDEIESKRRSAFERIKSIFSRIKEVRTAQVLPQADPCWFGVPIICPDYEFKKKLVAHLEASGIQTRNYFAGNILLHEGYKHLGNSSLYLNSNSVLSTVFFVGCAPFLNDQHFGHFEKTIKSFISGQ